MELEELLVLALQEDVGHGDITSLATIDPLLNGRASILAKQNGILCGINIIQTLFQLCSSHLEITGSFRDGQQIKAGKSVLQVKGHLQAILKGERVALNILGHLSGIATQVSTIVSALPQPSNLKILDTRKTVPLWRKWQKYAVKTGGGENHRFGLFDMILIKENHVQAAGSIQNALERSLKYRKNLKQNCKIEIEVKSLDELKEVIQYPVDIIMLDNMSPNDILKAIAITPDPIKLEVSGGITPKKIHQYAALGVDYISMGALTHSVTNFDFSLLVE